MKKETIINKGKKLTQLITITPIKGRKNRKGGQYKISKTTYRPNKPIK